MQPSLESAHLSSGVTLVKGERGVDGVPVNDERFWRRRAEDVPVDEAFFHAYFVQKNVRERKKAAKVAKRKEKGGEDEEDEEELEVDSERVEDEESVDGAEESEEELEKGEESSSEDGGFDLSTKGQKAVPAEGDDEEDDADSDAEEAEIWKVCNDVFNIVGCT